MKHNYRLIDLIMQLIMLITWLVLAIMCNDAALLMYFIVGSWFLLSLVMHFFVSSSKHKAEYKLLLIICLVIIGIALVGLIFTPLLMLELGILLFGAPILALIYTYNCGIEIRDTRKRPISLLK